MEKISIEMLFTVVGGLGIFLLGMIIMTEGLRSIAGDMMRNALIRFTRSPLSGAITGTVSTAILQSSSATTVATVGFVSAGLLAFPEALGIILGANIGTTVTGWMVALLGFKLNLGTIILPFILLGVVLKLFFQDKIASYGYTLAGFGLIFVGITLLQDGMSGFQGIITPDILPSDSWIGRLQLLALGILATLITQSSSAGIAAALTALYANAINFEQAAALVIGMDVGTTVTAVLATIGGSSNVKRTGLSHVVYNLFTATMALTFITPFTYLWELYSKGSLIDNAEIALVAFHSSFNILGVLIILPFSRQFATLMENIVPSKEPKFIEELDSRLLKDEPKLALENARISAQNEFISLLQYTNYVLGDQQYGKKVDLINLQNALHKTQNYITQINLGDHKDAKWEQMIALIHILDHTQRFYERCTEEDYRAQLVKKLPDLHNEHQMLIKNTVKIIAALESKNFSKARKHAVKNEKEMKKFMKYYRKLTVEEMVSEKIGQETVTNKFEAVRWLVRVSHHISRVTYHMEQSILETAK